MTAGGVAVQVVDRVLRARIEAPARRNALSRAILARLREVFAPLPDVDGVVLTGSGTVFSAGADLGELDGTSRDLEFDDELALLTEAVRTAPVPVVAAVEGPCVGAAVDLALACDARIAGADAWLRVPAVRLGILYSPRTIQRLHRTLPRETVTRLMLLGHRFDARPAAAAGLVTEVVPAGESARRAARLAAAVDRGGSAFAHTKRLLAELDDGTFDERRWQQIRSGLVASPERRTALERARRG